MSVVKRSRFVNALVDRLTLPSGEWIEVRHRLSGVETRRFQTAAFSQAELPTPDGKGGMTKVKVDVDMAELMVARIKAYVTDWNFTDDHGKSVPYSSDAVDALDDETIVELDAVLDTHVEKVTAESKAPSGDPASPPA